MSNKIYPTLGQSFGILFFLIGVQVAIGFIVAMLHLSIETELLTFIIYSLSFGIPLISIHYRIAKQQEGSLYNLKPENWLIILLVSVAVLGLQWGFTGPLVSLLPMPEWAIELFSKYMTAETIFSFATIVIAAPIMEEFVFRGIMLRGLLKNYSPQKAIFWSSFIFGLVHLNPWQFIGAFLIGLLLGWVYYRTGNLLYCIVIHLVNNGAAYLSINLSEDPEATLRMSITEMYGGTLNTVIIILCCIGAFLNAYLLLKKQFDKMDKQKESESLS